MKKKLFFSVIAFATMFFTGCGASADLKTENEQLKKEIIELQDKLDRANDAYFKLQQEEADKNSQEVLEDAEKAKSVYSLNETWTVDDMWNLTFTSVTQTDERNSATDKNPAQVIRLCFDYENIGYVGEYQDLFFSSMSFKVIDQNGEMADTYPLTSSSYPKETPVGVKCSGVEEVYGLKNASSNITVIVEMYDSDRIKRDAKFELVVQ